MEVGRIPRWDKEIRVVWKIAFFLKIEKVGPFFEFDGPACTLKFASPSIIWHHKHRPGRGEIDDRKGLQHGWNVENRDRL